MRSGHVLVIRCQPKLSDKPRRKNGRFAKKPGRYHCYVGKRLIGRTHTRSEAQQMLLDWADSKTSG